MKKTNVEQVTDEPLGIIISGGSRQEAQPRFSAYVWGPAPEPTPVETPAVVKAA